jgi:nuclease-like protein
MAARKLELRRADQCSRCGVTLAVGVVAWWDAARRTVTCVGCERGGSVAPPTPAPDRGRPGASLEREWERRRRNREQRTRGARPHLGGLLLAVQNPPQHEVAFQRGLAGERAVAEGLERRTATTGAVTLLHNRRMPGGRDDIDHIAIAPTGVYVIDAKDLKGKLVVEVPWFGQPKLKIGGRDRTKLLDGLERQIAAVRAALGRSGYATVPIQGVLCFTQADLPLWRTQKMRGHLLAYRKALAKRLNTDGPLDSGARDELARHLATGFPPA